MAERSGVDPAEDGPSSAQTATSTFIITLIAVVLIWTVLSYEFVPRQGVCSILQTIVPGETLRPLTQAEMDAMVAERCNRPNWAILVTSLAGYVAIAAVALRSLLRYARPDKPEKSAEP